MLRKRAKLIARFFFALTILGLVVWQAPNAGAAVYRLEPVEVADGVFVIFGDQAGYTPENGAAIANIGFIVGEDAVLVVDSGPTARFAEALLETIAAITPVPVRWAVITHHHPDHAFGTDAILAHGIEVLMHPAAGALLLNDGPTLLEFMGDLAGDDWTDGTRIRVPETFLEQAVELDLGGRTVLVTPLTGGHSPGDVIVEDAATQTLFAGDLVFVDRAATIPHADLETWYANIEALRKADWKLLVPGHGPLVTDIAPIDQMEAYLRYLETFARTAWSRGDTVIDALMEPIPDAYSHLAEGEIEMQRSLIRLFERFDEE